MKITSHTIAQLRDPALRRALCGSTDLLAEPCLAAQGDNPLASGDDVALLTAHVEGRVVGVIGVIPDWIFIGGERMRFGWMHNWNAPGNKTGGAGALLFLAAVRDYSNRIGVSGCTPIAEKIYLGSRKLVELHAKAGASFFFRSDLARFVPARVPRAALAKPFLRAGDAVVNAALGVRIARWRRRADAGRPFRAVELDEIDDRTARFIEAVRWPSLFRRGATELSWMRRFAGSASPRTWATGASPRHHVFLRVEDAHGATAAFVYLTLLNGTVKVPYFFCRAESVGLVASAVLRECATRPVRDVLVYSQPLANALASQASPISVRRPRSKLFLFPKEFSTIEGLKGLHVQDGDGDAFL